MNETRNILHIDINNCYASIECLFNPELKDKPVAVAGASEERHGIILAKNEIAKSCGVKTGEVIWQAKQKCPGLITLKPHFSRYLEFSQKARLIYERYTDRIEPFGIDECWLDVTCTRRDIIEVAEEIRNTVKNELGITVSVGGSFNKIFAKLGSDMKKPDAVTIITRENYKEKVWGLPASDMLFVGYATAKKLHSKGINTVGDIALTPISVLQTFLGKHGIYLYQYANGYGNDYIPLLSENAPVKSVSNGTTAYRDLMNDDDVKALDFALAESVASRLRKIGLKGRGISISIRDSRFRSFSRQCRLSIPTDDGKEIAGAAFGLYKKSYDWSRGIPIRSLTVGVHDLCPADDAFQLDMFTSEQDIRKRENLNRAVDKLRERYGYSIINRACAGNGSLRNFDFEFNHELLP